MNGGGGELINRVVGSREIGGGGPIEVGGLPALELAS